MLVHNIIFTAGANVYNIQRVGAPSASHTDKILPLNTDATATCDRILRNSSRVSLWACSVTVSEASRLLSIAWKCSFVVRTGIRESSIPSKAQNISLCPNISIGLETFIFAKMLSWIMHAELRQNARKGNHKLTSQCSALLQMIHALPVIALSQLLSHQSRHHALDPLFSDNCILGLLESWRVVVVDTVEGRRNRWFLSQEGCGFWGWGHYDKWQSYS